VELGAAGGARRNDAGIAKPGMPIVRVDELGRAFAVADPMFKLAGRQALDETTCLWRVAHLTGRQSEAHRTSQATDRQMDLGAQTAA
jgi:hypothetical protein